MSVDDVTDILAVDLIGTILDDEQTDCHKSGASFREIFSAEEEYMNICKRLFR